jgi:hypothetical protein
MSEGEWNKKLEGVFRELKDKYPEVDFSAITTPLPNEVDLSPVQAYTEAFARGMVYRDWDSVDKIGGEFVWSGTIKRNFPLFAAMVELIALAADDFLRNN